MGFYRLGSQIGDYFREGISNCKGEKSIYLVEVDRENIFFGFGLEQRLKVKKVFFENLWLFICFYVCIWGLN